MQRIIATDELMNKLEEEVCVDSNYYVSLNNEGTDNVMTFDAVMREINEIAANEPGAQLITLGKAHTLTFGLDGEDEYGEEDTVVELEEGDMVLLFTNPECVMCVARHKKNGWLTYS